MTHRPDHLSIIVFSGAFDRVHFALATAAAALAVNQRATLFFTMAAAKGLLAADADGPGWRHLAPGEDGRAPLDADCALRENGIGGFDELLEACVALGARVMVCEMGLRAKAIAAGDLRSDLPLTPGGLASFLSDASAQGAMLFI